MPTLRQILEVEEPKSADEKAFKDKHIVQKSKHPQAGDDVFQATNVKKDNSKISGHKQGEDEEVYEEVESEEDEEAEQTEGRRPKNSDDDDEGGSHIVMQLRKADDVKGNFDINFKSGKAKLSHKQVQKFLNMYMAAKPAQKMDMQKKAAQSPKALKSIIGEDVQEEKPPFAGPYKKAGQPRKDKFGNTIKPQNIARHLARKAAQSIAQKKQK